MRRARAPARPASFPRRPPHRASSSGLASLAGRRLDTNRRTARALFTLNHANREPVKAVPRIVDRSDLPDMGRMKRR